MPLLHIAILFASGLVGGIAAGMFGIGGGIIYVLVYNIFLDAILNEIVPGAIIVQLTILNAAVSIFFAASIGSYRQYSHGNFYPDKVLALGLTSAAMAFLTSIAVSGWENYNQQLFLILFTLALAPLIIKFIPRKNRRVRNELPLFAFSGTGFFSGIGSALSGLGGGFLSNPVLHGFLKYPLKKTFSISLGAMMFTTMGIILFHLINSGQTFSEIPMRNFNGIIYSLVLPVLAGVLAGTPFGIHLHNRFSPKTLSWLFFILAVLIGLRNLMVILS